MLTYNHLKSIKEQNIIFQCDTKYFSQYIYNLYMPKIIKKCQNIDTLTTQIINHFQHSHTTVYTKIQLDRRQTPY